MAIRICGDNTVASPAITSASDTDTGLQFGTNEVKVVNGNLDITDGNLIVASGHGIDFSATADGNGNVTGELLNEYEEGKWTPQDGSGAELTFASSTDGHYVKIGNFFHCWGRVTFPVTTNQNQATITNLPFTSSGTTVIYSGSISVQNTSFSNIRVMYEDTRIQFRNEDNNTFGNHQLSNRFIYFTFQGYTGTV